MHALAGGGDGVARLPADDGVVFVPDTAPGDRVSVRVPAAGPGRKGWMRGELTQVLESGPDRRDPPCPLAGRCGGCQWQHLHEAAQLAAKQAILSRALRQARVDATPEPPAAAPQPLHYRCRARLPWEREAAGATRLGFHARRSHRVVPVSDCPVLQPNLSARLPSLARDLPDAPRGEALLLGSPAGEVAVALVDAEGKLLRRDGPDALNLALVGERPLLGSPLGFVQANPDVNRLLRARLAAWAGSVDGPILELYAGSGNFTRVLAELGPVTAVESSALATDLGRQNLADAPVTFHTADVAAFLETRAGTPAPALVVLDPPRTGAREALGPLVKLAPPRLLYISCDPMTLARDAARLAEAGYALRRLGLLDTMPQTAHFECLAEFGRPPASGTRIDR